MSFNVALLFYQSHIHSSKLPLRHESDEDDEAMGQG